MEESKLIISASQKSQEGWIYLGKTKHDGRKKPLWTVNVDAVPNVGNIITTLTDIYLRESEPNREGLKPTIGIVKKGKEVKLKDICKIPAKSPQDAYIVWAEIVETSETVTSDHQNTRNCY